MVKKEIKKLPHSELEIKVCVPWEDWKNFKAEALKKLSKDLNIPGFRPGKVPTDLAEQKLGKNRILDSAASEAVEKTYAEIINSEKIEAIGAPTAEILKFGEGAELEYKIKLAIVPEIKIGSWEDDIGKINKKYDKIESEVKEEEVDKELKKLSESRTKLITVNREAKKGDNVVIDFWVLKNGIPIEGGTSVDHSLVLGKGVFIPGFEENIEGMKSGDEKNFDLNFPTDYFDKKLAGMPANFKVKVKIVQERQVPEISDDFARSLGKFENLESLKNNIKEGMEKEKEIKKKEEKRAELVDELVNKSETDIPFILVDEELKRMLSEFENQLKLIGIEAESYLDKIKKKKEDLIREWKPQAEKRIKAALALEKVAKDKNIEVSGEEIEQEMNKTVNFYKKSDAEKNIDLKKLYNYSKGVLLNEKVFEYLEKL